MQDAFGYLTSAYVGVYMDKEAAATCLNMPMSETTLKNDALYQIDISMSNCTSSCQLF